MAAETTSYYQRNLGGDLRLALALADEIRGRIAVRAFGVPREQSWLVTLIALGVLAGAAHDSGERLQARRPHPTSGDALLGAFTGDELLHELAGPAAREMGGLAALIALALVASRGGPAVTRSVRGMRASQKRMRTAVHDHYNKRFPAIRPAAR